MKHCLVFFTLVFSFCILNAQNSASSQKKVLSLYNEAKIESQKGNSAQAIELLNQILKISPDYYLAYFAMSDIYHFDGDKESEIKALNKGLKLSGDSYPNGFKFIAEALYSKGEYSDAMKNIEYFTKLKKTLSLDENRLLESCRFAEIAVRNPLDFKPENPGKAINTKGDEYWPSLNAESTELVFTRLMTFNEKGEKLEAPQEDFYISRRDSGIWTKAMPLSTSVNSDGNEGAQCISADGRLLFFTACGRGDGLGSCDIYMSVKQRGKWSAPVNLDVPVNSNAWESQPSVSANGRYLYFVSSRGGGKGKMDIWCAEKLGVSPEGFPVYGKAINVPEVNTPGNDLSPFIHADGQTLYFSSDFLPGLGGTDIFMANSENGVIQKPQNLGYPINTSGNEEGLVVEVSGEKAWYTANNKTTEGRDILCFELPETVRPKAVSYVKGRVVDSKSKALLLPDIILQNLTLNEQVQHIYPFENEGEFLFCLPLGNNYGLNISHEGYLFRSYNFDFKNLHSKDDPLALVIELDRIEKGKSTVLENIFFETDSWELKPESASQISELLNFMKNNPGLVVEIGGHTDNVASAEYNQQLSEKRAKSVADRLIENGISPERIKSCGYGLTKPIGDNATEQGRSANRRTEMKIMGE